MNLEGPHTEIKQIRVPLTERILKAHLEDIAEWEKDADEATQKLYQERAKRMSALFVKITDKK